MGWGGFDGYANAAQRLPKWKCQNCMLLAFPPRPLTCPQCGYDTKRAKEIPPEIWREDTRNRVGWSPPSRS